MKDFIGFRLRKHADDDIRRAVANMSSGELSEKARDGLRWALGFSTTRRIEIAEQPLQRAIPVSSKPTVFVLNKKVGKE